MNDKSISPVIVALACVVILLSGSVGRDLWTPDEPRVAAVSLEMIRTGQYLIPHLAGTPFIEKPPLYFAAAAGLINTLGGFIGNVNAARLTSVFFGLGTLLMTFLLAWRIYDRDWNSGIMAAAILVTMLGFVKNFLYIRVDAALCFFVIAAVWSFAEVYMARRTWFCIPAGFFAAGAFLSKGPIGLVMIAIPWFILFVLWLVRQRESFDAKKASLIGFHAAGLLIFLMLAGSWVLYLKIKGGSDLWHQWFWVNQVGRLTGAVDKGHIRTGRPFYYLVQTAVETLPWFPLILVWLWGLAVTLFRCKSISHRDIFLFFWAAGTILLLSLSATKRGIYMAPLFPAFSLICIPALNSVAHNRWIRKYGYSWIGLCICLLAVFTFLPFMAPYLPQGIPEPALEFFSSFGLPNIISAGACLAGLYLLFSFKNHKKSAASMFFATLFLYIGLFAVPVKAIDAAKSMRADIINFTDKVPAERRAGIAGYNFSETMLACFCFYADWSVPQIKNKARVNRIAAQADPEYDSIIINVDDPKPESIEFINELITKPYQVIARESTGTRDMRRVFWIKGTGHLSRDK